MLNINQSLSAMFVNTYNGFKEKGITYIPNTDVAKIIMIGMYEVFIKDGTIKKIEDLELPEKEKLVKECREVKFDYTNKTLIEQCKILHLINSINSYT